MKYLTMKLRHTLKFTMEERNIILFLIWDLSFVYNVGKNGKDHTKIVDYLLSCML